MQKCNRAVPKAKTAVVSSMIISFNPESYLMERASKR